MRGTRRDGVALARPARARKAARPDGAGTRRVPGCAGAEQDDEDTPTVTFPDDYPNSVRHFLLIGFLGMFIGAIVFFYMGISRKVNTVMHVLTFFIAAVSACAYYAEWAGLGVEYKTTDTTPRVIFWAHYLDWVVTGPVPCRSPCSLPDTVRTGPIPAVAADTTSRLQLQALERLRAAAQAGVSRVLTCPRGRLASAGPASRSERCGIISCNPVHG